MVATTKVLLIDDEQLMHLLYKNHLEKAGFHLLTASSAQDGLALARALKPSVIVTDIIMSDKDGLAGLRQLKAEPETSAIPVIVYTGATNNLHHISRREAETAGATTFLTKPIGPAQLVNEIRRLLPKTI